MIELKSIRIENIMPFISGITALDALAQLDELQDDTFMAFSANALITHSTEEQNISLEERISKITQTTSREFLAHALQSMQTQEHQGALRNIINLFENSQDIIDNGLHATKEISFMEAASNSDLLDIEGITLPIIESQLPWHRKEMLSNYLLRIRQMEMFALLSHVFISTYNYREAYKAAKTNKASSQALLTHATTMASHDFNLLEFLHLHQLSTLKDDAFALLGESLAPQAQLFFDAKDAHDAVTMKHALSHFSKLHRKILHTSLELPDEVAQEQENLTITANRFYYIREFLSNAWYADDTILEQLEYQCEMQVGEEVFIKVDHALDNILNHLKSLDAAVDNARIIQDVITFAETVDEDENVAMNNATSNLPSIISNDLITLLKIHLTSDDVTPAEKTINDPELKRQEAYIQKIVEAIPKGDPRRELIRQQLLKQFEKRNKEKANPDMASAREEHARNSQLPLPHQSNVGGFQLHNEAFNVRDGGIRLEDREITFSPNKGVNEVLITGATLSILAKTDPDKTIRLEGKSIHGLSIVNTARSDIIDIHVQADKNLCDCLTSKGKFRIVFEDSIQLLRIHSSVQVDGWNIRTKPPQQLQKEIGMVFDFINEHRKKKLAPNYQSDILTFSGN